MLLDVLGANLPVTPQPLTPSPTACVHYTYGQLKSFLATRLFDVNNTFWTNTEIGLYIKEAMRTFGLLSGFWRKRIVFSTSAGIPFYDLAAQAPTVLDYTVTDRDLIQQIQFHLLESTNSQSSWPGTEMFTFSDISNAIQSRISQFMADTGCVVTVSVIDALSPNIGREFLCNGVVDIRRVAWVGAPPENYYIPLWRSDERELTAFGDPWSVTPNTPEAYTVMATAPFYLQVSPPPISSGQLEMLVVNSGPTIDPGNTITPVGIPDDLTPAIKWGALADLLGKDGIARDMVRATYCEQRYQEYVQLARMLPVALHGEINGIPLIQSTLQEVETSTPLWENIQDVPTDLILPGPNLVALNPVPNGVYSATLDVVRKAVLPVSDADNIELGREQVDMILDYAEHLALFKVAGAEWHATDRQAHNFWIQAVTYNQRVSAAARYVFSAAAQSQRQKQQIPRRLAYTATGTGSLRDRP
jgi:hypothetical protein